MIILVILCAVAFVLLFVIQMFRFCKYLRCSESTTIPIACAGSPIPFTPRELNVQNYRALSFQDNASNFWSYVDLAQYQSFWVKGQSMLLCGINNDDILFVRPLNSVEEVFFLKPRVLVLKRDTQASVEARSKNDFAEYKIRRTWDLVHVGKDDIEDHVRQIINNSCFQNLKKQYPEKFLSEEELLEDFRNERLTKYMKQYPNCKNEDDENYCAIISTTLRTSKDDKVFFSIHPAKIIIGEVVYSIRKKEMIS